MPSNIALPTHRPDSQDVIRWYGERFPGCSQPYRPAAPPICSNARLLAFARSAERPPAWNTLFMFDASGEPMSSARKTQSTSGGSMIDGMALMMSNTAATSPEPENHRPWSGELARSAHLWRGWVPVPHPKGPLIREYCRCPGASSEDNRRASSTRDSTMRSVRRSGETNSPLVSQYAIQ